MRALALLTVGLAAASVTVAAAPRDDDGHLASIVTNLTRTVAKLEAKLEDALARLDVRLNDIESQLGVFTVAPEPSPRCADGGQCTDDGAAEEDATKLQQQSVESEGGPCFVGAAGVSVPRYRWDAPEAKALLDARRPVVLTGGKFAASAEKWSLQYILEHAAEYNNVTRDGTTAKHPSALMAMVSNGSVFKYASKTAESNSGGWQFSSTVFERFMTFRDVADAVAQTNRTARFYMQQNIALSPTVVARIGSALEKDMKDFAWNRTINLGNGQLGNSSAGSRLGASLWLGDKGTVTPLHFDAVAGLLSMARGSKCALLLPHTDENFVALRPFPESHPNFRQTQHNATVWSASNGAFILSRLPGGAHGASIARLDPGDALFIPPGEWHEIASPTDDLDTEPLALSFNFGAKSQEDDPEFAFHPENPVWNKLPRLPACMRCEKVVEASMEGARRPGRKAVALFRAVDRALALSPGKRQAKDEEAVVQVVKACDGVVQPVLRNNESARDFLTVCFSHGRFVDAPLLETGQEQHWDHSESFAQFKEGWEKRWQRRAAGEGTGVFVLRAEVPDPRNEHNQLRGEGREDAWSDVFAHPQAQLRKLAEDERQLFRQRGSIVGSDAYNEWCLSNSNLGYKLRESGNKDQGVSVWRAGAAGKCDYSLFNLATTYRLQGMDKTLRRPIGDATELFRRAMGVARAMGSNTQLRKKSFQQASIVSLRFAADQIEHLVAQELLPKQHLKEVQEYRRIIGLIPSDDPRGALTIDLLPDDAAKIPSYRRLLYMDEKPRVEGSTLAPRSAADIADIQQRYHEDGVVYIDNVLTESTLQSLYEFATRSTMYFVDKPSGYVGAYLEEGFNTPLLMQVSEEFRTMFPRIFSDTPLQMSWAYNYDDQSESGIHMHGDNFAVNCNLWITPDEANLDKDSGGLVVWTVPAPLDWDFDDFNTGAGNEKMASLVEHSEKIVIPYKQNRMVLFKSDLLHATDTFKFKRGFANRRINFTFLYGERGQGEDEISIKQRTERSKERRQQQDAAQHYPYYGN